MSCTLRLDRIQHRSHEERSSSGSSLSHSLERCTGNRKWWLHRLAVRDGTKSDERQAVEVGGGLMREGLECQAKQLGLRSWGTGGQRWCLSSSGRALL